jgi:HAD superfamily phosphatase (TIGR01668 family)
VKTLPRFWSSRTPQANGSSLSDSARSPEGAPPLNRAGDALRWVVWGTKVVTRGARDLVSLFAAGGLSDALEPWMRAGSALEIDFEALSDGGVRALLFDLENTLIPPGGPFSAEGRDIVAKARAAGLAVGVVSNASASWVGTELTNEGIPFVAPAGKPGRDAFERGCVLLGTSAADTVYVGDQMITDVLGAQRAGLRTILVPPRYDYEGRSARFQRGLARLLLRLYRKQP